MKCMSKILSWLLIGCMLLSAVACGNGGNTAQLDAGVGVPAPNDTVVAAPNGNGVISNSAGGENVKPQYIANGSAGTAADTSANDAPKAESNGTQNNTISAPKGEYNEGTVLVKVTDRFDSSALGTVEYVTAEPLYTGSKWYSVQLADASKTEDAVTYLSNLSTFDAVDYDYVMGVGTDGEAKVTDNPDYDKQTNLGLHNIPNGWTHNGKHPGGSADVVIAVIDTGVDYNHLDLRNNIWINTAEIADNGRDDDGNGYVDDVYGWDCVGNDKDPMDDNGHGTHVAGIIAAENNKIGGIGVAYNCKVMVLKAGNSSGYFNNSDIAEAVQYAYMNGASVINMSFGGSQISMAVEEALQAAYNTCVLVAAAGNDGACNDLSCLQCNIHKVCYPGALPYVIGVMSTDASGQQVSAFSNYDHNPYGSIEYEVYAVGEAVKSTWPNNKYATLNGTSMATPTVAGIAALLRSHYPDREMYSTKFIQSQIVNTGSVNPYNSLIEDNDGAHTVADAYDALTKLPKPTVNLYDFSIDDSIAISEKNNGNGVVDAGETIRLHVSLHNRGGVASNVNVIIDSLRSGEFTDPYFSFVNDSIVLSDIGTYSVRESGDKYFEIIVSPDCPNDYLTDLNIRFTYQNGLDEKDKAVYSGAGVVQFSVSRGYHLPSMITEDTVFTADKLYIVGDNLVIPAGVTVTFEEGCEIQFYDDREYFNSPIIYVYGSLYFNGTKDATISMQPSERYANYACIIRVEYDGYCELNYVQCVNFSLRDHYISDGWHNYGGSVVNNTIARVNSDDVLEIRANSKNRIDCSYIDTIRSSYFQIANNIQVQNCFSSYVAMTYGMGYIYAKSQWKDTVLYTSSYLSQYGSIYSSMYWEMSGYDQTPTVDNNLFFVADDNNVYDLPEIHIYEQPTITNNAFSAGYQKYAGQVIDGYYGADGNPLFDIYGTLADPSALWPYIVSVEMFDADGTPIATVGKEKITVRVTFNRPMDTTKDTSVTFGTIKPYADYRINGTWVSDTVWEGTYTLTALIENGQNYLKVNNACAAGDPTKVVFGEYQLHEFTIDTTAALAMNLQAVDTEEGVLLTFAQDDYDTLLGYNIYRSTEKDGNYVKLNTAIVLPDEETFLDDNAEPGKTYWYTYTVVLSDFTESRPAGKVQATAMDTMSPSLYHTPVNQGYENNNLVISCTARDNVAISAVTLYYRAVGATEWQTLAMNKQNDKYSATIFGSDVTMAGIEYYIVAKDGRNTVTKGTADTPYHIVVKSVDTLLGKGDVDGNGTVTTKDALMLMQCLNGDLILTDDAFKRADLNGDGILSSAEALRILQYINGKVNTLDM